MMARLIPVLNVLVFVIISFSSSTYINLDQNGYQKILVGISPDIKIDTEEQAQQVIKKIKDLFTASSKRLYDATRQRSFFQDIHILLPDNFPKMSAEISSTWQNYKDSDVFIDVPNPLHGDVPYASQPKGCGQQGDYIHLTPNYLARINSDVLVQMSAELVHVWSRFRYGIYEEYGHPLSKEFPMFYYDDNEKLKYTACSDSDIVGTFKDVTTGGECTFDKNTFLPDYKCGFFADEAETKAQSSIMSVSYLESIHTFCDDDDHPHNKDIPTKHNLICNGKSTWSIVTQSIDFANMTNPPKTISDLTPTFTLVRNNPGGKIVFVIDTSSSMGGGTSGRLSWVKKAVTYWIEKVLPDKTDLGMVHFSDKGTTSTVFNMINLTNSNRGSLAKQVNALYAWGGTCIGEGILAGIEVLNQTGSTEGGIMILMTDGQENEYPYIKDVINNVVDAEIRVITIAIGEDADPKIEKLAAISNGQTFYADDTTSLFAVTNALQMVLDILQPYDSSSILLVNKYWGNKGAGSFYVDQDLESFTVTIMSSSDTDTIQEINVNGLKATFSKTDFIWASDFGTYTLNVTKDVVGNWTYDFSASLGTLLGIRVEGNVNKNVVPITAEAWGFILTDLLEIKYIFLYADVKQNHNPVLNAEVTAFVTTPSGATSPIQLLDNGNIISDLIKGDGIYSRIMTSYDGKGRYTFNVVVKSGDQTTIISGGKDPSLRSSYLGINSQARNLYPQEPTQFTTNKAGDFSRNPGGFSLNFDEDKHGPIFPPGIVQSLSALWNEVDGTFTLKWSAPGSSSDTGKVSSYELKYSTSRAEINSNNTFENATSITVKNVVSGSLDPVGAGSDQEVVVRLDGDKQNTRYYFALRSVSILSNTTVSAISNIATSSTMNHHPESPTTPANASTLFSKATTLVILLAVLFLTL